MASNFPSAMPKRRKLKERKERAPAPPAPLEMRGFPKRLKDCIKEQDTTATAIAELAGVSVPVVTKAQKGEQWEGIGAGNAVRIAKALGVRPAWLLFGETPKTIGEVATVSHSSVSPRELARLLAAELKREATSPQVSENEPSGTDQN